MADITRFSCTEPNCGTCGEIEAHLVDPESEKCPQSKVPCGHHCNHSWTHDICCWCRGHWGEGGKFTPGLGATLSAEGMAMVEQAEDEFEQEVLYGKGGRQRERQD